MIATLPTESYVRDGKLIRGPMRRHTPSSPLILQVLAALVFGGAAILACAGDATGPSAIVARRVALADSVGGQLDARDSAVFAFVSPVDQTVLVFLGSSGGVVHLAVTDSLTGDTLGVATAGAPGPFAAHHTAYIPLVAGRVYLVRVLAGAAPVQYGLLVSPAPSAPERASSYLTLGDTVTGESLDSRDDVDMYLFAGTAGAELITFFQSNPPDEGSLLLEIAEETSAYPDLVLQSGTTNDLEATSSGRFVLPHAGTYRVTVSAGDYFRGTGPKPYRFQVRAVDRRPESGSAAFAVGDTVPGVLEYVGDIDEFQFQAGAGDQVVFFVQASSPASTGIAFELWPPGPRLYRLVGTPDDSVLLGLSSGRLTLPVTGQYTVRVLGAADAGGMYRGPYRFFLYRVRSQPEIAPATFASGDSVLSETIQLPGDWDEFQLTVLRDTLLNLVLGTSLPVTGGLVLSLLPATTDTVLARAGVYSPVVQPRVVPPAGTGILALRAGSYRVRVDGAETGPRGFRGAYDVWAYSISRGVEDGSPSLAIDDSVTGVLDPAGDWDTYSFTAEAGDHVSLDFSVTGPAADQEIYAIVRPADSDTGATVGGVVAMTDRAPASSRRLDLPVGGAYAVDVRGRYLGANTLERGTYQLALQRYGVATEHVDSVLPLGDSVVGEVLDEPGDMDQFVIRALPGEQMQVMAVMWGVTITTFRRVLFGSDPRTPFAGATFSETPWEQYTGPFTMPASGELHLRVFEDRSPRGGLGPYDPFRIVGPMVVGAWRIDSLPEGVPQAVAIGDTVTEEIAPVGDYDVYTFQGAAGDSLEVLFQTILMSVGMRLTVLDPSGAAIATVASPGSQTVLGLSTGLFLLAASGTHRIRVDGPSQVGGWKWPYRFRIVKR